MKKGIELNQFLKILNRLSPLYLAEAWDNVGLLVRPSKIDKVHKLLLTNDLTEKVLKEAIDKKVNFIFTYHPNIFVPLKSVDCLKSWKEKVVVEAIENSIAVYSPHTSLDKIDNGINDWILSPFDIKTKSPIKCSTSEDGKTVLDKVGDGRMIELNAALEIAQVIEISKKHFNLSHLRLALGVNHSQDSKINSIAVCAGSGFSILKHADVDLVITGEASHHDVLDLTHKNVTVLLTEHSNCERGYLPLFANILTKELGNDVLDIFVSEEDHDPLKVV